jgi:hypothetical protein
MMAVQKFVDFPSCEDFPVLRYGNVQRMLCPSGAPQVHRSSYNFSHLPDHYRS